MSVTIHGGAAFERGGYKAIIDAPSDMDANRTHYLPTDYGSAGQVLKTDGAGQWYWGSVNWSEIGIKPTTLAGYGIADGVINTRAVNTGTGLTGGGNLTIDRQIDLNFSALSVEAAPDPATDYCIILTAGGSHKRTLLNLLPTGAPDVYWDDILSKPTTIAGYSIIDAVTTSTGVYGGTGLSGGGTLETSRTIDLDIDSLPSYPSSPDTGILFPVVKAGAQYKMGIGSAFTLYGVSSGYGTSGGGLLSTSPTIELALGDLTVKASGIATSWYIPIVETDNTQWKATISTLFGLFSVNAGSGLSGGGAVNTNPSLAVDISGLTTDSSPSTSDYLMTHDVSSGGLKKVTIGSLPFSTGGGGWTITERTSSGDEDFYPGSGTELVNMNKPSGNLTVWLYSSGSHVCCFRTGGGYLYVRDNGGSLIKTITNSMAYSWFSWIGSQWVELFSGAGS